MNRLWWVPDWLAWRIMDAAARWDGPPQKHYDMRLEVLSFRRPMVWYDGKMFPQIHPSWLTSGLTVTVMEESLESVWNHPDRFDWRTGIGWQSVPAWDGWLPGRYV